MFSFSRRSNDIQYDLLRIKYPLDKNEHNSGRSFDFKIYGPGVDQSRIEYGYRQGPK